MSYFDCTPLPGNDITDYFLAFKKIGSGGFGDVFFALTTFEAKEEIGYDLPEKVAIKKIQSGVHMKMLRDEIQILKQLDTPRTMKYYGCFQGLDHIYIIIELVQGVELAKLIRDGKLHKKQKLHITAELALGIDDMHAAGYIHRDIKPGNIMYHPGNGKLTLLDYGLSCYVPKKIGQCSGDHGSFVYKDPKLDSDNIQSLRLSDWWSYGLVINYMYIGKREIHTKKDLKKIPKQFRNILQRLTDRSLEQHERPVMDEILTIFTGSTRSIESEL